MLNKQSSKDGIEILSSPQGIRVTHLLFADDCLIFVKANHKVGVKIRDVLHKYSRASGQKINFHKYALYFLPNCFTSMRTNIKNCLGIKEKHIIDKYLRINQIIAKSHSVILQNLLSRSHEKLNIWKQKTLSKAGRLILTQANLTAMPMHVMSCFLFPKKFHK